MADPSTSKAAPNQPRFRGLTGAIVHGLFLFALVIIAGLVAGGIISSQLGAPGLFGRIMAGTVHFGGLVGVGAAFSRWICGGESDRLLTARLVPGDFVVVGLLAGVLCAGFYTESTHLDKLADVETAVDSGVKEPDIEQSVWAVGRIGSWLYLAIMGAEPWVLWLFGMGGVLAVSMIELGVRSLVRGESNPQRAPTI